MPSTIPLPLSTHANDPILTPFLSPNFSPTSYLNSTLPSLSLSLNLTALAPGSQSSKILTLTDLTAHTQTHLAQLSAQTSRLSTSLTSLTDDILRSSSRLAYEVEILRGEALTLTDSLTTSTNPDLGKFLPALTQALSPAASDAAAAVSAASRPSISPQPPPQQPAETTNPNPVHPVHPSEPPSIPHLRTLHHVRNQLQATIQTFNQALLFPFPPSQLSSPLLSITAPSTSTPALEAAGQAALTAFRNEISELLARQGGEGIVAAEERVAELRALVAVWKGTAEERARTKFVDGLARMVAERRNGEEGKLGLERKEERRSGEIEVGRGPAVSAGPGFLRRLRDEIYLE